MKIGLDVMGGDHAPVETVKGAIEALNHIEGTMVLLGNESLILEELKKYKYDASRIEIIPTTEVVENEDKPVIAIKRKKMHPWLSDLKKLEKVKLML